MKKIAIGERFIGEGEPTYIVAEMSANHCGKFEYAKKILEEAKRCGADAVKLQTFKPESITLDCDAPDFLLPSSSPWKAKHSRFALYQEAYTPWEWVGELIKEGKNLGLEVFSSPFDLSAVKFLEEQGVAAYKIASPEITDIALLRAYYWLVVIAPEPIGHNALSR